jgi:hypothetical protein
MIRIVSRACVIVLCAAIFLPAELHPAFSQAGATALTADQLVAKVVASRKTSGFRIHAKLIRTTLGASGGSDAAKDKDTRQLLIKGRRDGDATKLLYQILWPTQFAGDAIVVEDSGDHHLKGFLYQKEKVTTLTDQLLEGEFFGSDLHVEDMFEAFWYWPSHKSAGEETIDKRHCMIVEMRPAPDAVTGYSMVKAWVSPDILLAMKVQFYGRDGKLLKTVTTERVVKQGSRWVAATLKIIPTGGRTQTVLEGTKAERDLQIPASDFTVDAIKQTVKPVH